MSRSVLEKFHLGMITDEHLVVESLHGIDPENPGFVLSTLPDHILPRALRFVNEFLEGRMVTNYGELPAQHQVLAAKRWLESALQQTAKKAV